MAYPEHENRPVGLTVLNPRNRPPVSLIIDDSTTLVNMAYFGIPQFAEVFPDRYRQPWRALPREIPDTFVEEFASYCRDHGVKGKYSIVPYPACTGWVDRFIPGWTKKELEQSLSIVRDTMQPDWDIHPEMISHTRAIDVSSGRPFPDPTPAYMENWGFSQTKSAEPLTEYMAYALKVLRNVGLPCSGVTTPGGFGSENRENLAKATLWSVKEVYGEPLAHYFRDLFTDSERSVAPVVQYPSDLDGADPSCVVHIIGCTGDWFGGWDGLTPGTADRFIAPDLSAGRMVDVLEAQEPAIMVCHWPGIYYNGEKVGFGIFQEVVRRLEARYGALNWMKLSEIARYWAARELTSFSRTDGVLDIRAPFAAPAFTVEVERTGHDETPRRPRLVCRGTTSVLERVDTAERLSPGTWCTRGKSVLLCFDLPRGESELRLQANEA
jgi:hypothetical protein